MSDFVELEYKYRADEVKLKQFISLMESLNPIKRLDVSSWDHYFTSEQGDSFQRLRESTSPELTKKIKVNNGNNWQRIEVDLPLDAKRLNFATVQKYVELNNYSHNFSIYKTCFIYWLDNINYVYYIVYDDNMKEQGRFIEVEVNKDKVNYLNSSENTFTGGRPAELYLKLAAKELEKLGLTSQNRMKKSLFELFIKDK